MKIKIKLLFLLQILVTGAFAQSRTVIDFNKNWMFTLGDQSEAKAEIFNDSKWRTLNLPHDWSIEGKFDEKNPAKPEGGGLPTGIAWYRKSFIAPVNFKERVISIEFDGIYKNSEVYLNGHLLGKRPWGYISFAYELTNYLKPGKNTIAVKVDNSAQPDSRWYSGSGIYRNVRLVNVAKISIAHWGVGVTTTINKVNNHTLVNINTKIDNKTAKNQRALLQNEIYDFNGKLVAKSKLYPLQLESDGIDLTTDLTIRNPVFWSTDNPKQYKLISKIIQGDQIIDVKTTMFGVRSFHFDAQKGFFLNGKQQKILGVCMHHDLGALGAAINVRAMQRQLEILKAMGCNAIRTAHNPPAPEFLDLCDQMGFLVMDEAFDMWRKRKNPKDYHLDFPEWHQRDLEDLVKRDRNHPSVIMWSIGNEIREQFDSTGIAITKKLVQIVKNIDPTRPVISALTETDPKKNFIYQANALDIYGLNYNHKLYKDFPINYPNQKFLATETTSALATRGYYDTADSIRRWPKDGRTKFTEGNKDWAASSYDNVSAYWGSTHEETWKAAKKYEHVSGLFVWTGFDYLGEPLPYPWPARSSYFGIVDLAGFPKDAYYLYQSEWTNKPVLHVFPHWNWETGKTVEVWAYYNNADEVELFLNGKSLGTRKKEGDDLHVMWKVDFVPGTLKAISRKKGKVVLTKEIKTAGKPAQIQLVADRSTLKADGKDLSFVTVKILDADGNLVPNASNMVQFKIEGSGSIAGVDNGFQASLEPFKANFRKAYNGLCLAIIQAKENAGVIKLTANSVGLKNATILIHTK